MALAKYATRRGEPLGGFGRVEVQTHAWVQDAAELLVKAAKSSDGFSIEEAIPQVQRALSREGML